MVLLYFYSKIIYLKNRKQYVEIEEMQSEILPIEIGVPLDDCDINGQKYVLPIEIKIMICNSLILSHINYCIMVWGYKDNRIMKI